MKTCLFFLCGGLLLAAAPPMKAGERPGFDVVEPAVQDQLRRITLDQHGLGGEIDRRIRNLVYSNYLVIDLDSKWLDHFRHRTDRGDQSHVYYGIGKVLDAGSLFAAYTGDPRVAARTQDLLDELVKSRDPDGYLGFWNVEPENRQNHINWILHEQEYINLAFVRNYRCTGSPESLVHARVMGDYILRTFPTPQHPSYDPGLICTAGLPEGMLELYRVTGEARYLDFAANVPHGNNRGEIKLASLRTWEQDFSRRPCHVYVMLARCYAQTELYRLTGETNLLHMSQFMRNELLKEGEGGLLVIGSCSEGEHFTYNQNGRGAIGESCVTAYLLRWIDSLLRLEGDLRYGDVIERTVYNALFAANSPDGRWIRYFTPFSGDRQYDTRDSFCCCGNYRRAVAELPQKVCYRLPNGGLALNLFTDSTMRFDIGGQPVTVRQTTAYPSDGEVTIEFSMARPAAFTFRCRTPRWCERVTIRVNSEPPVTVDPSQASQGGHTLDRLWHGGDVVKISMPMPWRFVRGRAVQDGRIALMRGPVVYGIGKDQNPGFFSRCPDPRNLVLDPASIAEAVRDDSLRPNGLKVVAQAWLNPERTGEKTTVTLTEFIDPSGQEIYFRIPDLKDTAPIRLTDDELVSRPNEFVNAHVLRALYGPKAPGDLAALFEIRGEVVADLAADYVNPAGKLGLPAGFPATGSGRWAVYGCRNGGLLSSAASGDVKPLNSQFKAFGSPLGFAYGLEHQSDQLGFVSDYAPSDRQEDVWRNHYTTQMFDRVLTPAERSQFLYTHPVADKAGYTVFRWTPSTDAQDMDLTLCGALFSNLGDGVELRIIRWGDDARHDLLGAVNTKDRMQGSCGAAEFTVRLPAGAVGRHLDFVVHNAGTHTCDATALRIQALTNIESGPAQTDVTDAVQAAFHHRLVTPLGRYAERFGAAAGPGSTLKLKLLNWQDGTVRYLELPQDSALDLR